MTHPLEPSPPAPRAPRCGRSILLGIVFLHGVALAIVWWGAVFRQPQLPGFVTPADRELASEGFELKYRRRPDPVDLLSYLAEMYLATGRLPEAVDCFQAIPTDHPTYGAMARFQQGRTLLTLHRAVEAESQFRELLAAEDQQPRLPRSFRRDARQRLRHILEVELRFEERRPLLARLVEQREADHFETVVYCFPSHLRWNGNEAVQWLEQFHAQNPEDRLLRIALGRYRTGQGKLDEARRILEDVLQEYPGDLWAAAVMIACLRESDDAAAAEQLLDSLPPLSSNDPWLLLLQRGAFALERGQLDAARAACDLLLASDPTNTEAWQRLVTLYRLQGDEPRRVRAVQVAAGLSRIQNHIGKGIQRPEDPNSFLDVAEICFEIDFRREGWILTRFAETLAPQLPRLRELMQVQRASEPVTSQSPDREPNPASHAAHQESNRKDRAP